MTDASFDRTLLIINPHSRNGSASVAEAIESLLDLGSLHILRADRTDEARDAIRQFGGSGARVVLGGGDGTLSGLLPEVLETGSTLGVLPLGTANDFARSLGIPTELADAIDIIRQGHLRRVDVGEANGKCFLNAVGIGIGPEMTRQMNDETKGHLGVFAYPVALLSVLDDAEPFEVRLQVDGTTHEVDCLQVTVGNGIYYGGGMTTSPTAGLDNGLLTVLCLLNQSKLRLAARAKALRDGNVENDDGVRLFSGRSVRLETEEPLEATVDGELVTRTPLDCRSHARSLPVFAPDDGRMNG